MKTFWQILPAGMLALSSPPLPTARAPEQRPPPAASQFSRVEDWARANQFQVRWLERDKSLQLSNGAARITLVVNSSDAQINGVKVRLSFPASLRNGSPAVSQLDLDKTFSPVLFPPANRPGAKIKTICLDPGHGGRDMGEHVGGIEEKKYTLLLGQELAGQLTRAGFRVVMTRTRDNAVDLSDRAAIARWRKADLFICLHFNSSPSDPRGVQGVETYCLTPAGAYSSNAQGEGDTRWLKANANDERNMLLAYQLQRAVTRELSAEDRGVKRARFQVLREATMPAILIEGGFLSHPLEQRKILDPAYRRQLARAILDGILAYKKAVKG